MNFIGNWFAHTIEELPHLLEYTGAYVYYENGPFRISSVVVTTWMIMALLVWTVFYLTKNLEKYPTTRRQAIAERITLFFVDFVVSICGPAGRKFYSIFGGIFITILSMNLIGLVPGNTSPTASYSTTLALALIGFGYIQYRAIREVGIKAYLVGYVTPNAFMLIGNTIGLVATPLSLSMRLYGNMFSGKVLDTITYLSIPILLPLMFAMLSLLSAFIQAYVFTLLLTMFLGQNIE